MRKIYLKPSITVVMLCQQTAILQASGFEDQTAIRDDEYGEAIKEDW